MKPFPANKSASQNLSPSIVDEKLLDAEVVILLQGTNLFGDAIYSYLKLTGAKLRDLFAAIQKGEDFKPSDFGTLVAAGKGEPTQELRDEMRAEYNMVDIPRSVPKKPSFAQPKFFGDNDNEDNRA